MSAVGVGYTGTTINNLTMTDDNWYGANIYVGESADGAPLGASDVTITPAAAVGASTIAFAAGYTFGDGPNKFYVEGTDKAGNSAHFGFTITASGGVITGVTNPSFTLAGFIDGVSEFTGNTVRRVRSGLSAVAATFSGGNRRSASATTESASQPRPRIGYQSSRERAEAARSPAVESTLSSRRAATGDSSAGRIAEADPAPRETERNRAPEREGTVITQPEKALAGDGETAGGGLEAASLPGNRGLAPAALEADQDAGMKGAAFFLAAFALLAAAAVFFTVRMRIQMRMQVKKSKDDTGE
jgi:hypothetical protein